MQCNLDGDRILAKLRELYEEQDILRKRLAVVDGRIRLLQDMFLQKEMECELEEGDADEKTEDSRRPYQSHRI